MLVTNAALSMSSAHPLHIPPGVALLGSYGLMGMDLSKNQWQHARIDIIVDVHAALVGSSTHSLNIPPGVALLGSYGLMAMD